MKKIVLGIVLSFVGICQVNALSEIDNLLAKAVFAQDLSLIKKLLDQDADPNVVVVDTPLLINAVKMENFEIVQLLLLAKARVDQEDLLGNTALMYAKSPEMIELLLDYGADVRKKNVEGKTVIDYAQNQKNDEILKFFAKEFSLEKLMEAILTHNLNLISRMLKSGLIDINQTDVVHEKTPLIAALGQCDEQAVKLLLQYGANPNQKSNSGEIPLFVAIENKFETGIKLLISSNVDINVRDDQGNTALMQSARFADKSITRLLLEMPKVNINAQNLKGETALMYAVKSIDDSLVKLLIDFGAQVNIVNQNGESCLFFIDSADLRRPYNLNSIRMEILKLLINAGINLDIQDKQGNTALMFLVTNKFSLDLVRKLLQAGATVNIKNQQKRTALDFAVLAIASQEMIELLLHAKAVINADSDSDLKKRLKDQIIARA